MLYDTDTMAYYLNRPFVNLRDMSQVKLRATVKRLNDFMAQDTEAMKNPEHDAISFYMTNHAFSTIRMKVDTDDELGNLQGVADLYFTQNVTPIMRAFYYLLLICTRESRHVHNNSGFHAKFKDKYGAAIHDFNKSIQGTGSGSAASRLRTDPPDVPLGKFTESLVYAFYVGQYSGGYGGEAWGKVADCLHNFVVGKYSAETMMDTVWTLCHNNGPIFNKGMLYTGHSGELITILDVQRSGQIPQLVWDHSKGRVYLHSGLITSKHTTLVSTLTDILPELACSIDWPTVEALGSVKKYPEYKKKQVAYLGGSSVNATYSTHNPVKKPTIKDMLTESSELEFNESQWFFVTPTEKVSKLTRDQLKVKLAQTA